MFIYLFYNRSYYSWSETSKTPDLMFAKCHKIHMIPPGTTCTCLKKECAENMTVTQLNWMWNLLSGCVNTSATPLCSHKVLWVIIFGFHGGLWTSCEIIISTFPFEHLEPQSLSCSVWTLLLVLTKIFSGGIFLWLLYICMSSHLG